MFRVLGFCGVISTVPGLRGGHRLSSAWKTEGPEGLSDRLGARKDGPGNFVKLNPKP